MKTKIILIGGFCETIEFCQECGFDIVGVVDFSDEATLQYELPYLGNDEKFLSKAEHYKTCKLVICPDAPKVREKIVLRYKAVGFSFAQVISPSARVSPTAVLGEGLQIQAGALISAQSVIGDFVRINCGAQVFHDCKIGAYTTLAPTAFISGRVTVAERCYFGVGSIVLPNIKIGEGVTVGAGAVVTKDVEAWTTVAGIPAKKMERKLKG
jgi:UDP-perosamine 4-acetyltransferase